MRILAYDHAASVHQTREARSRALSHVHVHVYMYMYAYMYVYVLVYEYESLCLISYTHVPTQVPVRRCIPAQPCAR